MATLGWMACFQDRISFQPARLEGFDDVWDQCVREEEIKQPELRLVRPQDVFACHLIDGPARSEIDPNDADHCPERIPIGLQAFGGKVTAVAAHK